MFKLNICLFYFDGPLEVNAIEKNKINSGKLDFYYSKISNIQTINLFYNLNHYDKFYEENEYFYNKEFFNELSLKLNETIFLEDKDNCFIFHDKNDIIKESKTIISPIAYFIKQNIKVCPKVLKNMVDRVLFERAKYLDLENYISKECKLK
jgi:hypothetical protein